MKSSHPVNCRKHPLNSKSGSLCFRVNNGGGGGGLAALPTPNDQQAGLSPSVCLSVGLSHDTREHAYLLGVRIFSDHCPHTGIGQPTRPGLHVWVSISDGRRLRHILTYCCGASLGEGLWELHPVSLIGPCAPPPLDSGCCILSQE